jgi:hypothetical protein
MVTAFMSTIPGREVSFKKALESLVSQVDEMHIAMSGFSHEDFCNLREETYHRNVFVHRTDNSLQDGHKLPAYPTDSVVLLCDDDTLYPSWYAKYAEGRVTENPGLIYSFMGKRLKKLPLTNYYGDDVQCFRTFEHCEEDTTVHIPGTGSAFFSGATIPITQNIAKVPNTDVCVGVWASKNGVGCVCVAHYQDDLKDLSYLNSSRDSIFRRYRNNDQLFVNYINEEFERTRLSLS